MKRMIALLQIICIFLCIFTCVVHAEENFSVTDIEYFEDGSYIITVLETKTSLLSLSSSISKTKTEYFYDSHDNLDWKASLTATFNYNGSTASCTNASIGYKIYDNTWRLTSHDCSYSGATATGSFTFKRYASLIPVQTINKTLTLTCSPNGTIT